MRVIAQFSDSSTESVTVWDCVGNAGILVFSNRKRGTVSNEENAAEAGAQAPDGALDRYGNPTDHPAFNQFVATISALRAPDGCPWDREQTHASISHNMIEEAYEAVCAIEEEDTSHLREELGDVLLQVVLQSQIAADEGEFSIDDVCADVNAKMVRRHPHVFGSVEASNASEVLDVWDQVKLAERQAAGDADGTGASKPEGLLDGVPRTFPALMEAQKISRKAAAVGFEWDSIEDVWGKVAEEKAELIEAYASAPHAANGKIDTSVAGEYDLDEEQAARLAEATEMEFGDVLFALVNVGRRMGIDAESALRASNAKFRARWAAMEEIASQQGKRMQDFSTSEQNKLWGEVKGK